MPLIGSQTCGCVELDPEGPVDRDDYLAEAYAEMAADAAREAEAEEWADALSPDVADEPREGQASGDTPGAVDDHG